MSNDLQLWIQEGHLKKLQTVGIHRLLTSLPYHYVHLKRITVHLYIVCVTYMYAL